MFKLRNPYFILTGTILLSLIMHWPHMRKELMSIHVWRQTQTQSTINSFYEEDFNILHPKRLERGDGDGKFRMEFPLMQWTVAAAAKIFGNSVLLSRILMFLTGIAATLGLYQLLLALFRNATLATVGAWCFTFSPAFFYYTINPLPDNMALAACIWGLALFFRWIDSQSWFTLFFCGLLFTVATLCKLPFVLFFIVPGSWMLRQLFTRGLSQKLILQGILVLVTLVFPAWWYITVIPEWGENMVIKGMLNNQDGSSQLFVYLQHNLFSNLPELLLNYGSVLFFIAGLTYLFHKKIWQNERFLPLAAAGVAVLAYYLFEANAIAKIHDYYLFPFLPLLFILVTYGVKNLYLLNRKWNKPLVWICLTILPLTCFLRMQSRWNPESPGFNVDLLNYQTALRRAVPENALVIAGNDDSHFIFLYYIHKKGWGFDKDNLTAEQLTEMISRGARYLYTDSDKVLTDTSLKKHFQRTVNRFGTIHLIELRQRKN